MNVRTYNKDNAKSSPALQSRSNLNPAFAVRAQLCSETYRDVEATLGAGSTTGGSIQPPYNCSTNEANLILFQTSNNNQRGGETTRYMLAPESPPTSNCPTRSSCAHKTKRKIKSTGTRRSAPASAQRLKRNVKTKPQLDSNATDLEL